MTLYTNTQYKTPSPNQKCHFSRTDPATNSVVVETNGYDADGRLVAHWTPAKGLTTFGYDVNGNRLTAAFSSGPGISSIYDSLNRLTSMSDAFGTSTFTYANFGAFQSALATETGPWAADTVTHTYSHQLPQSLTLTQPNGGNWTENFNYDSLLRLQTVSSPAGTFNYGYSGPGRQVQSLNLPGSRITEAWDAAGQVLQTALNSVDSYRYGYDLNGNRLAVTNLITFRGGSGWAGSSWPSPDYSTGDNTYWVYDPASGALLSKTDAQGRSVNYTYDTTTGRLLTRSWARLTTITDPNTGDTSTQNVTVTNYYNGFGDLTEQDYNDGTPSVQYNNYNRAGQPREIVDGSGTNEMAYDFASRLVSSTYVTGPLTGITVSNHFNPYYGRDALTVSSATSWNLEDDYGYDSYGRLGSVTSGSCTATYGYVPNSDLLQSTTFKNGSTTVLSTTRTWNFGFQLRSIANTVDGTPVTSHAYQYDNVNRRTEAALEDGSSWQYGYNDRNELTGANRYWYDSHPVSGQMFGYSYDNIGNRTTTTLGGDSSGGNLRTISYGANSLNQYTNIVTPGLKDIIGAGLATNSVIVNGGTADRYGEYFHRQISVANTNQPVWQNVTNISGMCTNQGGLVFPANNQTLVYDADGNLTFDGVWNYQWDGENRLISMNMTNVVNIAATNRLRLDFAYDYMGRRVQKMVFSWTGSDFAPQSTNFFVCDGWNLTAVLNPQSSILQSFVWGNDLSGTTTGLDGIGGLLAANIFGTNYIAAFDGNGNLITLINSLDKSLAARYEYSPYGELLRSTGLIARNNPFRCSTKFWDDETGFCYYGCRYYDLAYGRWLSRDPSQERGGHLLYNFTGNSPIDGIDRNGLDTYLCFRRIGGDSDDTIPPSPLDYNLVHEFVFTTDDSGNVDNTFSWGNHGGKNGWVKDADNDKMAAQKALKKGWAVYVDDKAFDALVRKAFDVLKDSPDSKHSNGLIFGLNCQTEAMNLIHQAQIYAELETDED